MRTSQARERLLTAAVRHALDAGIADLSLRQLAAAIGTSHRMLIYHFGSKAGLIVAVIQTVEDAQRAAFVGIGSAAQFVQKHQRFRGHRLQHLADMCDMS